VLVAVLKTASPVEESAVVASVLVRQSGSLKSTVDQKNKSDPRSGLSHRRAQTQVAAAVCDHCVGFHISILLAKSMSNDESGEVKAQACH